MKDKSTTCSHCGKTGHDAKGCFQLIGYPKRWGARLLNRDLNRESFYDLF